MTGLPEGAKGPRRIAGRGRAAAWVRAAILLLVAVLLAAAWARFHGERFVDFPSYWLAAELTFNRGVSPYGAALAAAAEEMLGTHAHPFIYPPFALPILWPLSLLGYMAGAQAFLLLNAAATVGICLLLGAHWRRENGALKPWHLVVAALLVLGAQAVRVNLGHGQVNLLVVAAALAAFLCLERGRGGAILAGLLVAGAITLKLYAVVLLAPLILRGRWAALASASAALALLALLSVTTLPAELWSDWMRVAGAAGEGRFAGGFDLAGKANVSLTGILLRLDGNGIAAPGLEWLPHVFMAMLVSASLATTWRGRHRPAPLAEIGAYLSLIALLPANVWVHYVVFVLPGAAAVGLEAMRRRSATIGLPALACWTLLLLNPVSALVRFVDLPPMLVEVQPFALSLLVCGLCLRVANLRAREPGPSAGGRPGREASPCVRAAMPRGMP